MKTLYNVSASPHVRSGVTTRSIMRDVAFALIPASIAGIHRFGIRAGVILLAAIASAVLSEYVWMKLMKKQRTQYECSALVTGLLLGMNLPYTVPIWVPILGSAFAIIVVKELFGGLGQNFMNPALGARCFLLISFAGIMTDFGPDALSGATPLAVIKDAGAAPVLETLEANNLSILNMFLGKTSGVIGEVSAAAILAGAVYLIIRRVISPLIPCLYIGSFAVFAVCFGGHGFDINFILAQILSGGLMLGAFFMATDYVTSPITKTGKIVYAVLLGLLTAILRFFGNSAEGVSYAIIFCNLLVPLIEKVTIPKAFGKGGKKA